MHTSDQSREAHLTPSEVIAESILELLDEPDASDRHWRAPIFQQLPKRFAKAAALEYKESYIFDGRQSANISLLEQFGPITSNNIPVDATDDDLKELARRIVRELTSISRLYRNRDHAVQSLLQRAQKYGVNLPALDNITITAKGLYTRLTDEYWWLRILRKTHAKKLECQAIRLGFMHQRAGVYVSDETLKRRQEQKARNRRILEGLFVVNELDEGLMLSELAEHSLANPRVRRSELMVRIFGFEFIANEWGTQVNSIRSPVPPECMRDYQAVVEPIQNMTVLRQNRRRIISIPSGKESAPNSSVTT